MNNERRHFMQSNLSKAIVIAIATASVNVQAEETDKTLSKTTITEEKKSPYKTEKVSTHKISTSLLDTAKTINVVDGEVLSNQGVTSLNDALRNVTGVSTFGAGEGGGGNITTNDKITIRGFSANNNIYIDGIRDVTGYSRDLFTTEQIEVTKGASSSITGKGSSGGTVNLVTKKAKLDDFMTTNASFDDADTKRITLDLNKALNNTTAFRLNAVASDGGDPLNNGVETYQTFAIAPSIFHQLNKNTTVTADALLMKQDNLPMLGLPYVTYAAAEQLQIKAGPIDSSLWDKFYGNEKRDFEEVNISIGTIVVEHQWSDNLRMINQTRAVSNDKKSVLSRPIMYRESRGSDYENGYDTGYTRNLDEENTLFVNQFDVISHFNTGDIAHDLVVGLELYKEEKTSYKLINNIEFTDKLLPLDQPNSALPFTGSIERDGAPTGVEGTGSALYVLDTIHLNEQWILTAGLRFEDYSAKGSAYMWQKIDGKWNKLLRTGLEADSNFISWNSSLNYKPTDNANIYISYANSQDPGAGDLAFSGRANTIDDINELDPQESKNFELGAKVDLLDGDLQLSTAYFVTTKTVTDRDDDGVTFLSGEQEAKGFELSLTGSINENFSILAGYTHQSTEVTKDFNSDKQGNGLTAAPDDTANIWLQYEEDKITLALGAQYTSGNTFWRRNRAYFETNSGTIAQAMAAYKVTDDLNVQLNIDNLTDKEYITDFSARGHFRPGAPRKIKLSVNYQF
jgi:catecholate siderophore receptor